MHQHIFRAQRVQLTSQTIRLLSKIAQNIINLALHQNATDSYSINALIYNINSDTQQLTGKEAEYAISVNLLGTDR